MERLDAAFARMEQGIARRRAKAASNPECDSTPQPAVSKQTRTTAKQIGTVAAPVLSRTRWAFTVVGRAAWLTAQEECRAHKRPYVSLRLLSWCLGACERGNECRAISTAQLAVEIGATRQSLVAALRDCRKSGMLDTERLARGLRIFISPEIAFHGTEESRRAAVATWIGRTG